MRRPGAVLISTNRRPRSRSMRRPGAVLISTNRRLRSRSTRRPGARPYQYH
jgi:hypothetical protein